MKKLGIIGGGQLGRMLAQAAKVLDIFVVILDPTPGCPASEVADECIVGSFKDEHKIRELAEKVDFLTFEIELANNKVLEELSQKGIQVNPSPKTLGIIRDKYAQKVFLQKAGIPTAEFWEIKNAVDVEEAAKQFEYPIVLKAKFDAYDGRGNALIESPEDIPKAMEKLNGRELYVEKFVPFSHELAVVAARGIDGTVAVFPIIETIHKNHILDIAIAPGRMSDQVKQQARDLAIKTLQHLQGVGVFCLEMFIALEENILINEIAPRVHNSGHLTIEACSTSQFEQHVRAVTGQPLGDPSLIVPAAVMVNILGERNGIAMLPAFDGEIKDLLPDIDLNFNDAKIFAHIYGKIETREQRKMGHITITANDIERALKIAMQAKSLIEI